jgi:hypothetical protein
MSEKIESRDQLISEIADALQQNFEYGDAWFYVSPAKNEVGLYMDGSMSDPVCPDDEEEIVKIEPLNSHESFGCMEDFADQVEDERIQRILFRALQRRHPFSNFRYAVDDVNLLQDWYAFKDEWYKQKAEEWMHFNDVDFKDGHITAKHTVTFLLEDEDIEEEDNDDVV